jgi:predicted phosphodiesterase
LSDLHFTAATPVRERLQWLSDDIKHGAGLGFEQLDYVVITGDFTDRGCSEGFEKAYEFVAGLIESFGLSAERFVFVPGNHDLKDLPDAFEERENKDGHKVIVRTARYSYRLQGFSDQFFHKFLQRPYPMTYPEQGMAIPFWEKGIQFLTLNSCWQIDQYNRKQAGVHCEAVANVIREAQKQEQDARRTGQFADNKPILRIAAWHHALAGPSSITDVEFLGHLQNNEVRIVLHGDVHQERRDLIGYWHRRKIYVIGAGSFGASAAERPESTPRLYNLLEIKRDLKSVRVHTRCQPRKDGPWRGWNEWEASDGRVGGMPYYDISWDV